MPPSDLTASAILLDMPALREHILCCQDSYNKRLAKQRRDIQRDCRHINRHEVVLPNGRTKDILCDDCHKKLDYVESF